MVVAPVLLLLVLTHVLRIRPLAVHLLLVRVPATATATTATAAAPAAATTAVVVATVITLTLVVLLPITTSARHGCMCSIFLQLPRATQIQCKHDVPTKTGSWSTATAEECNTPGKRKPRGTGRRKCAIPLRFACTSFASRLVGPLFDFTTFFHRFPGFGSNIPGQKGVGWPPVDKLNTTC
jgi:hypothetical protein